ncbi:MAG: DUF4982 domain-containing protein [Defluviitaleaceae bacterium]|nr:DUF4982 domain-containing protein [Defluviitaleaceae bacterium]
MKEFTSGWQFSMEGQENWSDVVIPHDWLIKDTKNLYKDGIGCYRKVYKLDKSLSQGERVFLRFDGVYQDSTLYVNGKLAGEWKNGYTAFSHEITEFLQTGDNEILMKVKYESPNTRWYSGAGIYRDVWLVRKNAVHFVQDGIYIKTRKISETEWHVEIDAEVESAGQEYTIDHHISCQFINLPLFIPELVPTEKDNVFSVENLQPWDLENPAIYGLKSVLIVNGKVVDTEHTFFGFREIAFTPEGGFFLNGQQVTLYGCCHHHDLGALGSAVHRDAIKRQLQTLKDMGMNAIRTAHNPPAAVFMELCDEMGILVMSEFTDIWKRPKTKYDYARFFEEWSERDVAAWIRRDRNCPSIIMWSVGNEIHDTETEGGAATLTYLMEQVRRHDPKCNAEITLCSNYLPWESTQKCADMVKLIGFNYAEYLYANHAATYPDWVIYGGETSAIVQSRGVYHFPLKKALLADDDLQCSALGNSATSWGAKSTETVIRDHLTNMGQFIWTGFDYIGEPTPYHTKNSYFGQIDTAGFPKDSFYMYASAWVDVKTRPILHLYPYWDWSLGQLIDVRITTNAPRTELFLNGKKLTPEDSTGTVRVPLNGGADYIVPYEAGCLKAIAYDENGNVIAECERNSFGDAVATKVEVNDMGDLIFAEITAIDANNNPVENANNRVNITVQNGELLGLDNGDSTDYDQYQGVTSRRLFGGKLLAIYRPDYYANNIYQLITAQLDTTDIPIRKIELLREESEGKSIITAKIHPANATYSDLQWRLADSAGIDSPLGKLTISGERNEIATLHPKGDGEVYIRCATNNGKDHINLISMLPITIEGYGKPFLDPYTFISGGLYNRGNDTVTNGNERGIATARDRESTVGFADLDFGTYGADEITLWLFPLSGAPFEFDIWRGMPDDSSPDSKLLLTPTYDKGSIWNTYIEVTYKLPEKLRGIQTLGFAFRQKVHIKGFTFKSKTYETIPFAACDNIYGDSYKISGESVEGIGNNVTITFAGMNFEETTTKLELSWRSQLDKNTITLIFNGEENEISNLLTLPASTDKYSKAILNLDTPLKGKGAVSFIFLPGSEIDLQTLKFHT